MEPQPRRRRNKENKRERICVFDEEDLKRFFLEEQSPNALVQSISNKIKTSSNREVRLSLNNFFRSHSSIIQNAYQKAHIVLNKILDGLSDNFFLEKFIIFLLPCRKKSSALFNQAELLKLETRIPEQLRPQFLFLFNLPILQQQIEQLIQKLIQIEQYEKCFVVIELTGGKLNHIDVTLGLKQLLIRLSKQTRIKEVLKFVKKVVSPQRYQKYFHQIQCPLLKAAFNYFFRQEGWEICEEVFWNYPELLALLARRLKKKNKTQTALSLIDRHYSKIKGFLNMRQFKGGKFPIDNPNPLHTDKFLPSNPKEYLSLTDYSIGQKDVIFVEPEFPRIEDFLKDILASPEIGLDTQSIVGKTKIISDFDALALIQVATHKKVYLFDGLTLQNPLTIEYFNKIFSDKQKKIIGHTIDDDVKMAMKCFQYPSHQCSCQVIEIKKKFKKLFDKKQKMSLLNISQKILGKPICKQYTLTNWERRPLLLNQVHYAAMDAFIVLKINQKLDQMITEKQIDNK